MTQHFLSLSVPLCAYPCQWPTRSCPENHLPLGYVPFSITSQLQMSFQSIVTKTKFSNSILYLVDDICLQGQSKNSFWFVQFVVITSRWPISHIKNMPGSWLPYYKYQNHLNIQNLIFNWPESDHWLPLSLTHLLTHSREWSLPFSRLDWSGQLKTCWFCYCCWRWWWGSCWQQFVVDSEGEVTKRFNFFNVSQLFWTDFAHGF